MLSRIAGSRRTLPVVLIALLGVLLFNGCAKQIPLTTMNGGNYEVVSATSAATYADRTPQDGNEFLLVSIRGQEDDLDDMQSAFYGEDKATVTDETTTATCEMVVYVPQNTGEVDAVLVFQVPTSFGPDFTLEGAAFQSVALSLERGVAGFA